MGGGGSHIQWAWVVEAANQPFVQGSFLPMAVSYPLRQSEGSLKVASASLHNMYIVLHGTFVKLLRFCSWWLKHTKISTVSMWVHSKKILYTDIKQEILKKPNGTKVDTVHNFWASTAICSSSNSLILVFISCRVHCLAFICLYLNI